MTGHQAGLPVLTTTRLTIRTLRADDATDCRQLYDDIGWSEPKLAPSARLELMRRWTTWSADSDREYARLQQPPFGDRAVLDKATGAFVGLAGLVPVLEPFGRLPSFGGDLAARGSLEMGLFWAISPRWHRQGRATEAAAALIDAAFERLGLARIVATTEHDNHASIGVMRRLGMRIERNPLAEPFHFQTVGRLDAGARP
jgi:RimJ/RimL family protein N-acetyltransferase